MDIEKINQDYDDLILITEESRNSLLQQMNDCLQIFKSTSKSFLINFLNMKSIKIITENIELTQSIGIDGLSPLKEGVNQLIVDIDMIVEAKFDSPSLWWHLEENTLSYYCEDTLPEFLDKEFRYIIGMLGDVMSTRGYIVTKPTAFTVPYNESIIWAELDVDTWVAIYKDEIEYTPELIGLINNYAYLIENVKDKNAELNRLQIEKEKAKITNMWNSI